MTASTPPSPEVTWPPLPLDAWRNCQTTLHMWTQVVGKTRLALAPMENHWWHCTLYVSERGLTTTAMPAGERLLTVEFDFIAHLLVLRTSDDRQRQYPLASQSVARFYAQYLQALRELDVTPTLFARPVEVPTAIPFAQDEQHADYDPEAVSRWWRALIQVDHVFKQFRSSFLGKQSPAHFFWGSFDLAVTRFSGRKAPRHPGGAPNCPDYVMVEAYSHECSSAGFWPGGGPVDEAAFYAYAYPEPEGYAACRVEPAAASYHAEAREFILPYEAVRTAADPQGTLLRYLQTTYEAASTLGNWNRPELERQP